MFALRIPAAFSLLLTLVALAAGGAPPAAAVPSESAAAAPGELIVRFAPTADAGDRVAARVEADVDFERALALRGVQLVRAEPGQSVSAAQAELEDRKSVV